MSTKLSYCLPFDRLQEIISLGNFVLQQKFLVLLWGHGSVVSAEAKSPSIQLNVRST
jgi:hypothetical protein